MTRIRPLLPLLLLLLSPAVSTGGESLPPFYSEAAAAYDTFSDEGIERSIRLLEAALDYHPGFSPARSTLAEAYIQRYLRGGSRENTLLARGAAYAEKALLLDPRSPAAHKAIGSVYYAAGKIDEAMEELERAVDMAPDYGRAWLNLGMCRLAKGDRSGAKERFRQAAELAGDNLAQGVARFNLAALAAEDKAPAAALAQYEEAAKQVPLYPPIRFGQGVALMELGRDREAIKAFRKATELEPHYAEAWYGIGAAAHRLGESGEATAAYNEALRLDPGLEEAERGLAALEGRRLGCLTLY